MPIKKLFIKEEEKSTFVTNMDDLDGILAEIQMGETSEIPEEYADDYVDYEAAEDVETIDEFYDRIDMSDRKIYDVVKFIDGIPSSIDSVTRKITLMNMLSLSNYVVDELVDNADKCIASLQSGHRAIQSSTDSMVSEIEDKISVMLEEIDVLKNNIEVAKKNCETQKTLFRDEVEKIEAIKNHII